MGNYIRISTQQLSQDRNTLQEEIKGIGKAVEELSDEMQLLGQTWEGPAWNAFQVQVAEDIGNMQEICEKLSVYIRHIENAEKEYRTCNSQIGGIVDSIRV